MTNSDNHLDLPEDEDWLEVDEFVETTVEVLHEDYNNVITEFEDGIMETFDYEGYLTTNQVCYSCDEPVSAKSKEDRQCEFCGYSWWLHEKGGVYDEGEK